MRVHLLFSQITLFPNESYKNKRNQIDFWTKNIDFMNTQSEEKLQNESQIEEGRAVSRWNAVDHGILKETFTPYEKESELAIINELAEELAPKTALETLLVERIATHFVKLKRVTKAEGEYIRSVLDPQRCIQNLDPDLLEMINRNSTFHEGYVPRVNAEAVEKLLNVYNRYETSIENRFYKAMRELRELRATKV